MGVFQNAALKRVKRPDRTSDGHNRMGGITIFIIIFFYDSVYKLCGGLVDLTAFEF